MANVCLIFLGLSVFYCSLVFYIFWAFSNKTIPLALVGYEMIIANSALHVHVDVHALFSPVALRFVDLWTLPMFLEPFQTRFLNLQSHRETLTQMLDNTSH